MKGLIINGQRIPNEVIQAEVERLALDPNLQAIADANQRSNHARTAAEYSVVSRTLVEQIAIADPRGVDPDAVNKEVEHQKMLGACRSAFDDSRLRQGIEMQLRVNRTLEELVAGAKRPTEEEVRAFYAEHGQQFRAPEILHAAHIVKHVNEGQTEEEARRGIQQAMAELEQGEPFSVVADRWSDCKGNGGDLGTFPRGSMVSEVEDVLNKLGVGERSEIFVSPFGFHIAELRGRQPGGSADFEFVRADIERVMNTMAEHQAFIAEIEKLRSRADIRYMEEETKEGSARAAGGQ